MKDNYIDYDEFKSIAQIVESYICNRYSDYKASIALGYPSDRFVETYKKYIGGNENEI